MPKYRATKYIRLSYTNDRSTESDSVGNQRKLIDDFVSRNPDIEIVSERIDDGYSGTIFERPEIQRLIEMVRSNQVDCIIVKDDCVNIELKSESLQKCGFCDVSSVF